MIVEFELVILREKKNLRLIQLPTLDAAGELDYKRVRGGFLVKLVHGDHWEMLETDEVRRVSALLRRELATLSDATATAEPRRDAALPVA